MKLYVRIIDCLALLNWRHFLLIWYKREIELTKIEPDLQGVPHHCTHPLPPNPRSLRGQEPPPATPQQPNPRRLHHIHPRWTAEKKPRTNPDPQTVPRLLGTRSINSTPTDKSGKKTGHDNRARGAQVPKQFAALDESPTPRKPRNRKDKSKHRIVGPPVSVVVKFECCKSVHI